MGIQCKVVAEINVPMTKPAMSVCGASEGRATGVADWYSEVWFEYHCEPNRLIPGPVHREACKIPR